MYRKAYTIARVHASDYPHIYDSVTGMLTLGTPHEGLSIDKGLQQMFEQTAPWGMRMENSLIGVLHRDNDFLVSIVHDFTREINTRKHPPQICCFFEERAARFGSIAGVETELVRPPQDIALRSPFAADRHCPASRNSSSANRRGR